MEGNVIPLLIILSVEPTRNVRKILHVWRGKHDSPSHWMNHAQPSPSILGHSASAQYHRLGFYCEKSTYSAVYGFINWLIQTQCNEDLPNGTGTGNSTGINNCLTNICLSYFLASWQHTYLYPPLQLELTTLKSTCPSPSPTVLL